MTQNRMIPSTADAPTLTLAACVLAADHYPQHMTPNERQEFAMSTVDAVMILWNEITDRIASGILVRPLT